MVSRRLMIAAVVLIAVLAIAFVAVRGKPFGRKQHVIAPIILTAELAGKRMEIELREKQEIVYHMPSMYTNPNAVQDPESKDYASPRGLLYIFHGCNHAATDFGYASPSCPGCMGLPAEMKIVEAALKRRYAVLALSSEAGGRSCFSAKNNRAALHVLDKFQTEIEPSLKDKPVVALGISAGGMFIAQAPKINMTLAALCIQVATLQVRQLKSMYYRKQRHPPTMMVFMKSPPPQEEAIELLRKMNVPAEVILAKKIPITIDYFSKNIRGMSPDVSEQIYTALKNDRFLEPDGTLSNDPRRSLWRFLVQRALPNIGESDNLRADMSPISELMNMAYAYHEITSEYVTEMFDFFDSFVD